MLAATVEPHVARCDLNGDQRIDGADQAELLSQWGGAGAADFDGSGAVDGVDLATLLANFGRDWRPKSIAHGAGGAYVVVMPTEDVPPSIDSPFPGFTRYTITVTHHGREQLVHLDVEVE